MFRYYNINFYKELFTTKLTHKEFKNKETLKQYKKIQINTKITNIVIL